MNSYYEDWVRSAENWMKQYRSQQLKKAMGLVAPAVMLILAALFAGLSAMDPSTSENILYAAIGGLLLGLFVCLIFLLILLPGLSPRRMRRGIEKAAQLLRMNEIEKEQLGREMLAAEKDPAYVLDYKMVSPKSKATPARFLLSHGYACLWGSYPLVILVRLSEVAKVCAEEEKKIDVATHRANNTIYSLTLHTIVFYYKNSPHSEGDDAMGFFEEETRDLVLAMIQEQRESDGVYDEA